ncbi:hypothetical protein [Endozoicomonas numazuensis]|uniref:Uncharacterized protein n=1 Tax=Endozoicomonas numazuensis TaxID=1137799 RepID=A0A081NLB3_9GAMM|nr:hypothetical protein [Endozoicomonas numazuensis]KEQ19236.1 hypothetical protein GZ78_04415 [Endozoicomonas numazuensis]
MHTIEQQISQNLGLIDQAAREGRACRVTLHNGVPVVETSPTNTVKKNTWKLSHRRNKAAEKKLRDMVVEVIGKPDTRLALKKQVVEGVKARRYRFFSERDASVIEKNEALLLAPVQQKPPASQKKLPKRKIKLLDAMESNGSAKLVLRNPRRDRLPDAMKSSGPAKVVKKREHQERPPIPFTPPSIVISPPQEEAVKLDSSRLVDFDTSSLLATPSEDSTPPVSEGIPYTPTPVDLPDISTQAPAFQVSGPISLVPLDQMERPDFFPKEPGKMLGDACHDLAKKMPNINLADANEFLWLYYTCEFLEVGSSDAADELKTKLDQNFSAAGLSSQYKRLQTEKMWQAVRLLKIDRSPEAFTRLIDEMSEIGTPLRFKLTQHLVKDIDERSFRKVPNPNGDPAKKVDSLQLEFLEQVQDTDELMEDLGFEIYDPDESDKPLTVRSQQVDVRAQLKDELLIYSTEHESFAQLVDQLEAIDPDAMSKKVKDNERLTPEELNAIVAAKKQKLEIAQTLGRKWGDSLLLDGRNWPDDDARHTLLKLHQLAILNSPVISTALNSWILNKHQEKEYHPQVVIEGSSSHGLLAALTQVEAGADVTLLLSSEPLFDPAETIRLDPQWIETLRFHLGGQFDQLFTSVPAVEYEESRSGLIHSDGFGEVSASALHQALWNQVQKVAQYKSSPLRMVSNTRVTEIETPDQHDEKYLLHVEQQNGESTLRHKIPVDLLINAGKAPNAVSADFLETVTKVDEIPSVAQKAQPKPPKRLASRCTFSLPQSPTLTKPTGESPFDIVVPDKTFHKSLVRNILDRLGHKAPPMPGVREKVQADIRLHLIERKESFDNKSQYKLAEEMKKLYLSMKTTPMHLKTFHSESRESLQLEMELPQPISAFLDTANAYLKHNDATPQEAGIICQHILSAWFETVAIHIQLPKRGIRPKHLRPETLSTFSAEQTFLEPPVHTLEANNSILTLTAIGPAAVNNPLSPEANQSSAREHILQCQALTEKLSEHHTKEGHLNDPESLLEDAGTLEQHYELLNDFVNSED